MMTSMRRTNNPKTPTIRRIPMLRKQKRNPFPRYDPPTGTYNAANSARFVSHYRGVARGFIDAMRIRSLRRVLWMCPNCNQINRNKDMNDLSGENPNCCKYCKQVFTYDQIRLGLMQ